MGKFDGILLCTDLDDTLLTTDKRVSDENRRAIEYFQSEGGLFTFVTGRVPAGARLMLEYIHPNAPVVCFNGAAIYDFEKEKFLWKKTLPPESIEVLEFIDKNYPFCGIEVSSEDRIYFSKWNRIVKEHKRLEKFPDNDMDYHDIKQEWLKVIFMVEEDEVDIIRNAIKNSPWADTYDYVQSSPWYYELLPKGASKGAGIQVLAELCGINPEMTVGMGDNDNDMSVMTMCATGIAVSNAIPAIKRAADYITVDNNSSAAAAVIHAIENGQIKLKR